MRYEHKIGEKEHIEMNFCRFLPNRFFKGLANPQFIFILFKNIVNTVELSFLLIQHIPRGAVYCAGQFTEA